MIEMIFNVSMFTIWFYVGIYNMLRCKHISNTTYFLCWITLLLYITAALIL